MAASSEKGTSLPMTEADWSSRFSSAGQALQQRIEQRLARRVHPLTLLDEQQQWLELGFPQEQRPGRGEGERPPLGRSEGLPRSILDRHVEEGEEHGHQRLEGAIERE